MAVRSGARALSGYIRHLGVTYRVLYHIDESRGDKVVSDILGKKYEGILGCNFLSAYNELDAEAKQRCLGHFLTEIKKVQEKNEFAPV